MGTTLLVIQIILTIFIVIVVLLQKSSSIGLGAYSGSNDSVFGAKGPASFMVKLTVILGILFVFNTIGMAYFFNKDVSKSVVDTIPKSSIPLNPLNEPTKSNPHDDSNSNPFSNKELN